MQTQKSFSAQVAKIAATEKLFWLEEKQQQMKCKLKSIRKSKGGGHQRKWILKCYSTAVPGKYQRK